MLVILYAVLILGALGGLFGLVLAVASKIFEVKKDPRIGEVLSTLPGANCGGCGFAGCAACAEAIVAGRAPVNACPVCSGAQTTHIAAILGVDVTAAERRVAFVRCAGGTRANRKFHYIGLPDCAAALKVGGTGPLSCAYGCLGFGSCMKVCTFGAIHINQYGVAQVNPDKCTDCRRCMAVCPQKVIVEVPYNADIMVNCSSKERGAVARSNCAFSCITCRLCEKNCASGAVTIADNIAVIDYTKCTSCGTCAAKCPRKVIRDIHADGKVMPVVAG